MGGPNPNPNPQVGLIVGNYCHDVLLKDDAVLAETLGGAVSFISAVLDGLHIPSHYVSKVGPDFSYNVNHPPIVSPSAKTTVFHAFFVSDPSEIRREDRVLKRVHSCDPILPHDLFHDQPYSKTFSEITREDRVLKRGQDPIFPRDLSHDESSSKIFSFGMAVGIGGEISPETLEKMLDLCDVVFVDVQALIRDFDETGIVKLVNLTETGFAHLVPRIGFLKASAEEAPYVDVDQVRKYCCVVVTGGKDGCTVYWEDGEVQIEPFPTGQVDPTGAGDSFLAGLVAGLVQGLAVPDAALLGNFFGSLTVGQIGLPEFDSRLMQNVMDVVRERKMQCDGHDDRSRFTKPSGHEQFLASLSAAKLVTTRTVSVSVSPNVEDQVLDPNPGCTSQQMLFLNNGMYEEPVKSIDANP